MTRVRMAQIGTRHGHAAGKWCAMWTSPDVEPVGIWEPDPTARGDPRFGRARWCESEDEILGNATVVAVAIEGRNDESLAMAESAIEAGKHLWFDKPAGDDWPAFQTLMARSVERGVLVQMGYMFRYQPGFQRIADLVKEGLLGEVFSVRAHMSTWIDVAQREVQSVHAGGILYDLGGHMIDQIVWLLGRPARVTSFLRNDGTPQVPAYADNTLAVLEFDRALAVIDIAAMEARPMARRFEVYGTRGSAITEPFDPGHTLRLTLSESSNEYAAGEHLHELPVVTRQNMYERELAAFVDAVCGVRSPDRSLQDELLVQETLLRATGRIV